MTQLGAIDWCIIVFYFATMIAIGYYWSRGQRDTESYFLGKRRMPKFAVALSVLATTLSAATFVSVPALAFGEDLTYLIMNLGGLLAAFIVAGLFIPPLYRAGTVTVYGFLGIRYGKPAVIAASLMFLLGRLLASGARLFIAAIAFAFVVFGDTDTDHLLTAIIVFGLIGTLYTILGGIRAVIWTDTIQICVVVAAALLSIVLLLEAIPLPMGEILAELREFEGKDKLRLLDSRLDWNLSFTLWTGLIASTFVSTAAYSVDQDMVQRLLTARSPRAGGISLISSTIIGIPVVCLFLGIGLLLSIYYGRPDLMGPAAPLDQLEDPKAVFPQFVLNNLPAGIKGLAIAGLFAAAMSSLDSAINAMASSVVADLYLPFRERYRRFRSAADRAEKASAPRPAERDSTLQISRLAVGFMGLLLIGFALLAVFLFSMGNETLISFALGVMAFTNAPLLGIFSAAIFTRRGSARSIIAALVIGCLGVLLLQPYALAVWFEFAPIAWPWWWVIVSPLSFAVAVSTKGNNPSDQR